MNDKFVHVSGPFSTGDDVVTWIRRNYDESFKYIKKCGIQSKTANEVIINDNKFEFGKTGTLEFSEVRITSILFSQDEPATTVVDCILE